MTLCTTCYVGELNKSQTWEEGDLLASISGRTEDEVDEAIPLSMTRPSICHYLLSVNVICCQHVPVQWLCYRIRMDECMKGWR